MSGNLALLRGLAAIFALVLLSVVSTLAAARVTPSDKAVAVFFPPWWGQAVSMDAAAKTGPILGIGGFSFVVLVPNASDRKVSNGEWLRLSASAFHGCFQGDVKI